MAYSDRGEDSGTEREKPQDGADTDGQPVLAESERSALHELQLAIEHIHRAYSDLLAFHHRIGHAMDRFATAEERLREAGHGDRANTIRDRLLPAGAVGDRWTYELVEAFDDGLHADAVAFENEVRAELANGEAHITERAQQDAWRERARRDLWRDDDPGP